MSDDSFEIESIYDHHFDTLALRVTKPYEYKESIEFEEGFILDFDKNEVPVAFEMLNASKLLNVPKYALNNPTDNMGIHMNVTIDEKSIIVKACFEIMIHNREQTYSVESFTSNNSNIPNIETALVTV